MNEAIKQSVARKLELAATLLRDSGDLRQIRVMVREAYEVLDITVDQIVDGQYPTARNEKTGVETGTLPDERKWVECPFYPRAVDLIRAVSGSWDHDLGKWVFPKTSEWFVIESTIRNLYGTILPEDMVVDVEYPLPDDGSPQWLEAAGRVLVERRRIGGKIVLGRGVTVVSGGFDDLPESSPPSLRTQKGTVVKINAVPIPLAEELSSKTEGVRIL